MSDKEPVIVVSAKIKPIFYIKKFIILILHSEKLADAFVKDVKDNYEKYINVTPLYNFSRP